MTVVSQECAMEYKKKNANTDNSFITVLAFNSLLLSLSERASTGCEQVLGVCCNVLIIRGQL